MTTPVDLRNITKAAKTKLRKYAKARTTNALVLKLLQQGEYLGARERDYERNAFKIVGRRYNAKVVEDGEKREQERKERAKVARQKRAVKKVTKKVDKFNWSQIMEKIKENPKNMFKVSVIVNGKITKTKSYNRDTVDKSKIYYDMLYNEETEQWEKYRVPYDDGDPSVFFVIDNGKKLTANQLEQTYAGEGDCFFVPILEWAEKMMNIQTDTKSSLFKKYRACYNKTEKFVKAYPKGVTEDDMQEICDELSINVSIHKIFQKNYRVFKTKKATSIKNFDYINTRRDHVDAGVGDIVSCKPVYVEFEELEDIYNKEVAKNKLVPFQRSGDQITAIYTTEGAYKCSNETAIVTMDFEEQTGLKNCKLDWIADEAVSEFIASGTHFNGTVDFKDVSEYQMCCVDGRCGSSGCCSERTCCIKCCKCVTKKTDYSHMDCFKQYANCGKNKYFEGYLGKVTNYRECDRIMGTGIYQIDNLVIRNGRFAQYNDKMQIYESGRAYPSGELKMLSEYADYDIIAGCWGERIDFDFNDHPLMMDKYKSGEKTVSLYSKYIGACASRNIYQNLKIKASQSELEDVLAQVEQLFEYNDYFYDQMRSELSINLMKRSAMHLSQVSAFVTSYSRMTVIQQLMTMKYDDIIRVCVDGIFYHGDYECTGIFREKPEFIKLNVDWEAYITQKSARCDGLSKPKEYHGKCVKKYYSKTLLGGVGGGGKTHGELKDGGYVRPLFVAPTHKLKRNKVIEYGCKGEVLFGLVGPDNRRWMDIKRRYNVIILDEVSQYTNKQKELLFRRFTGCQLIFMGDIGFQTEAWEDKEINEEGFDDIIRFTHSYRIRCNKLRSLCARIRSNIDNPQTCANVMKHFESITVDELKKQYDYTKDTILCRSHQKKDTYTELFADQNKWYVTATNRDYANGEIVIGDKPKIACEIRHGYTIHSIQGETCEGTIYIDMKGLKSEPRILYTAVSRARYAHQIKVIV